MRGCWKIFGSIVTLLHLMATMGFFRSLLRVLLVQNFQKRSSRRRVEFSFAFSSAKNFSAFRQRHTDDDFKSFRQRHGEDFLPSLHGNTFHHLTRKHSGICTNFPCDFFTLHLFPDPSRLVSGLPELQRSSSLGATHITLIHLWLLGATFFSLPRSTTDWELFLLQPGRGLGCFRVPSGSLPSFPIR